MGTLCAVPVGSGAIVTGVDESAEIAGRLKDFGFTRGAKVRCLFLSPAGNPRAYYVRGSVVALRNEDAERIAVDF